MCNEHQHRHGHDHECCGSKGHGKGLGLGMGLGHCGEEGKTAKHPIEERLARIEAKLDQLLEQA